MLDQKFDSHTWKFNPDLALPTMTAHGQSPGFDSWPLTILVLSLMPQIEVLGAGPVGLVVVWGWAGGVLKAGIRSHTFYCES